MGPFKRLAGRGGVLWALAALAVLLAAWRRLLLEGLVPVDGHMIAVTFPGWAFFREGFPRLPLWNPTRGFGLPHLADPVSMALYPPLWLLAPLRGFGSFLRAWVVLHTGLAAAGAWALAWRLHGRREAAWTAALLAAFNGFFTARVVFLHHFASASWLPAALLFQQELSASGVGAVLALQWLAGYPPFSLVTGLFLLAWALGQGRGGLLCLLKGVLAAAGLAAAQWVPFSELLRLSSRGVWIGARAAIEYSIPPVQLLKELLLPQWYALSPAVPGDPAVLSFYAGPVGLALALAGLRRAPRSQRPALGLAGACLALSLGGHLPGYACLPVARLFRFPANWLLACWAALLPLAAAGVLRLPGRWRWAAVALLGADLALYGAVDRTAWAREGFFTEPPPLAGRVLAAGRPARIYHAEPLMRLWLSGWLEREEDYALMKGLLAPSYGAAFGVQGISDYQTLRLRSSDAYRARLDAEGPSSPLLAWSGAACVVSIASGAARVEGPSVILRPNPGARPRVFPVSEGSAAVSLLDYRPGEVLCEVAAVREAGVVFSESAYPGWTAAIDGREAALGTLAGLFPVVRVPPGRHLLSFRFRSAAFLAGAFLSLVSLALFLARLLTGARRRPRAWARG